MGCARAGEAARGRIWPPLPIAQWLDEDDALHEESLRERIVASIQSAYDEKAEGLALACGSSRSKSCCKFSNVVEGTPASDGPVAPGYSPARLCQQNPKQEYKRNLLRYLKRCSNV
ncbi:MAG: hypothetical protein CM15mP74_01660 [Halieaceae bacterium]|nr:MAG: hypothetical protein CM15mP74_01660 [Halieaceae bacterium]